MPINKCQLNKKKGFKYGSSGKCYTGVRSKAKARKQGVAIKISQRRNKMRRAKPCQHKRRLRSGKTITINKGRQRKVQRRRPKLRNLKNNSGIITSVKSNAMTKRLFDEPLTTWDNPTDLPERFVPLSEQSKPIHWDLGKSRFTKEFSDKEDAKNNSDKQEKDYVGYFDY